MSQTVTITLEVDDEFADPDHRMGVTNECYEIITESLARVGTDIEVEKL